MPNSRGLKAAPPGGLAAVLASLIWYGTNLAVAGWTNELTVLQIPMSFQYLGMPVGCFAMAVWLVWDLVRILRGESHSQRWRR